MENANQLNQLGNYKIIEKLGEGAFAEVYRAVDSTLDNRPVALKILKPALLADQHFLQRFQREAGTMAKLSHPHIATIYGFDESRGKIFIAMQLARGFTLAEQISKSGAVPLPDALNLLRPICQALDYAHQQGVVHRDLKPANILIDSERGPLLTDFGLARLLSSNSTSLSMSGGIIGTHSYIALEVWEGNEATPAADIYSLGCIVYELLTGQVLFTGPTPMAIMRAHDRGPQFDLALLSPDITKVLQRALSPEPENRYATAEALWNALKSAVEQAEFAKSAKVAAEWQAETRRAIKAGEWRQAKMAVGRWLAITPNDRAALAAQAEIERGTAPKPPPYRPQPEPSSKRWQIVIVSVLLVVVAGATGWLLRDQSENPSPDGSTALTATAQVAEPATQIALASTATDMPTPTRTPTPTATSTLSPVPGPLWDAVVSAAFTSLRRQPDSSATSIITLNPGDDVDLLALNEDRSWVQAVSQARTGWLPVDKLKINIDLDSLPIKEGASTRTPTPASISVSSETTPQVSSSPKLKIFLGMVGNEENDYGKLVRQFTAETGIEVDVVTGPQSATDFLNEQMEYLTAGSSEIDVFQIDVIWPGIMAPYAVDLSEYVSADAISAHFPTLIENNTKNGKLVGLPWQTDAGLLYYRTDLLEKYGYSGPPETWDELEAMASTIQQGERAEGNGNFWGFVWQGNAYEGLTCDALEWQASEGGGLIIEPEGVITVNNPAAAAAMERAAGWVGTISPPGVTGYQEEDSRGVWQSGNAAFMRNWPYAYALSSDPNDGQVAGKFDIATLPAGAANRSAATLGGWQLMVSRYSNNIEAAARFVAFMTGYEAQKARAISSGYLPTIPDLYQDQTVLAAQPQVTRLLAVFNNSVARPSTVADNDYNAVSNAYFNAIHDILTGRTSAGNALADLEQALVNITGLPTGTP